MKIKLLFFLAFSLVSLKGIGQETQQKQIDSLVLDYHHLKAQLFKGKSDSVRIAAKDLYNLIGETKTEGMTANEKKAWLKFSEKLSYDAEHIKGTAEIEHQREHFISLSSNMFQLLKQFQLQSNIYYEFCPMANDNKGAYWISENSQIENPYFGKKMPGCGSVKDSLIQHR